MRMGNAAKLILISFDSTLRSNLSVGMPIDLLIYRKDELKVGEQRRIEERDPYFRKISAGWSQALRNAFAHIDEYGEDSRPETGRVESPFNAEPANDKMASDKSAQATAGWIREVD
jgi:putative proteasome-type protease